MDLPSDDAEYWTKLRAMEDNVDGKGLLHTGLAECVAMAPIPALGMAK